MNRFRINTLGISGSLNESRFRLPLLSAFVAIGLLAAVDIVADIRKSADITHVVIELFVFVIAITFAVVISLHLLKGANATRQLVREMKNQIRQHRREAVEWRNETRVLLQGLGASINRQFERWQLTESEKEVALFLLKGLSHKEIAVTRGVSEATARQQARAIYRKAGLTGRNELAAFFLEELALPVEPA